MKITEFTTVIVLITKIEYGLLCNLYSIFLLYIGIQMVMENCQLTSGLGLSSKNVSVF
jgi:hypothetical protein